MDKLTPQNSRAEQVSQRVPYTVRKKDDNKEYDPNFLRAFFASFVGYLKKKLWTLPYEKTFSSGNLRKLFKFISNLEKNE